MENLIWDIGEDSSEGRVGGVKTEKKEGKQSISEGETLWAEDKK